MKIKEFKGVYPYLVTPMDRTGCLKEEVLGKLVDSLIQRGIHGLTPLGSTGEGPYLDRATKKRVVQVVMEAAAGRVPVIAGINNMTTVGAMQEAADAESLGVDGILVVLPNYFPVDQSQVISHFQAVARAVSCPVTLYTNPEFATWDFSIDALKQLAEEPNIRYLKDASGNIAKLMSISIALKDKIKIFSASAHIPVFVMMLGGVGWMAGPACLIPEQSVKLFELAWQKKWEEAIEYQKTLWPLNVAFQKYSLAACVKAGLEIQGFDVGPPLAPQTQLDDRGREVVRNILKDLGAL